MPDSAACQIQREARFRGEFLQSAAKRRTLNVRPHHFIQHGYRFDRRVFLCAQEVLVIFKKRVIAEKWTRLHGHALQIQEGNEFKEDTRLNGPGPQ